MWQAQVAVIQVAEYGGQADKECADLENSHPLPLLFLNPVPWSRGRIMAGRMTRIAKPQR